MSAMRAFAVFISGCLYFLPLQWVHAAQTPNETDAKRFIQAYRAHQVPIRMLHYLGIQERLNGNLAKGDFLECMSVTLLPDDLAKALVPFVMEQFSDSETINRVSGFLEGPSGKHMLDGIEANLGRMTTIVENKVQVNLEKSQFSLSKGDLDSIHNFERTPDYLAFNKFVENVSGVLSKPEMKFIFDAAKRKCFAK
jgi:hypothetical protein